MILGSAEHMASISFRLEVLEPKLKEFIAKIIYLKDGMYYAKSEEQKSAYEREVKRYAEYLLIAIE
jgi:hypothetical protein